MNGERPAWAASKRNAQDISCWAPCASAVTPEEPVSLKTNGMPEATESGGQSPNIGLVGLPHFSGGS